MRLGRAILTAMALSIVGCQAGGRHVEPLVQCNNDFAFDVYGKVAAVHAAAFDRGSPWAIVIRWEK